MQGSLKKEILSLAQRAKQACVAMAGISDEVKKKALLAMSQALIANQQFIIEENKKDLELAKSSNLSGAFMDRLTLSGARINKMSDSLKALVDLPDPVGGVIKEWRPPQAGFLIKKVRVPIGVIAIIYESRPDVTSDCIGLCLKSGNCVLLRGGSEAINSNKAILQVLLNALNGSSIPQDAIGLVSTTDRAAIKVMLKLNDYIDLVIPRGGEGLIKEVTKTSSIPVIKHYKGICHVYVDEEADLNMAQSICFNAKVQRPGVCNAMETMLVQKDAAIRFLPGMIKQFREAGVEIRGCPLTRKIAHKEKIKNAKTKDFRTEYLDLILSVKVVQNLDEAILHINTYGTHHSDTIVTENQGSADYFLKQVDSACVYHNVSTRFTDGFQFGLGAEIGISTDKIHARGPMALEELTTYKYLIYGSGQVRT
jgi:glutamate-5-semialdehyde dehydrogenase